MSNESRLTTATLLAIAGLSVDVAAAKDQVVYGAGSLPTFSGPEATFTGQVDVAMAFPERDGVPYSGAYVTFQPGARTAWHEHPAGQHMVVTRGTAITATREGQVVEFHEGESVWCPEGVDHWHGATPNSAMTHFVVTASKDGDAVIWKDKVTDEQYQAALDAVGNETLELSHLSQRHQHLATVVAFAAADDLGSLKIALNRALDANVSINELKEALVHLYPYGGFPKSLNALGTLMSVVDQRKADGKEDAAGEMAQALPEGAAAQELGTKVQTQLAGRPVAGPLFDFVPVANTFLQKHLFGDVFARGILDYQDREILTVAILAALSGTDSQLSSHIGMARNAGVSQQQLDDLSELLEARVTRSTGLRVAAAVLDEKG